MATRKVESESSAAPFQAAPADASTWARALGALTGLNRSSSAGQDLALALVRLAFGLSLALNHGLGKLASPQRFIDGLVQRGFPIPGFFGWAAISSELIGGLLLALGLLTRLAASLVLVTLSVAAFYIHAGDPFKKKELALAFVVVSLAVLIAGPGRYSLDGWLSSAHTRGVARRKTG